MESNNKHPRTKNLNAKHNLHRTIRALLIIIPLIFNPLPCSAAELITIAFTQIVEHPSLEKAKLGIMDVLKENGYENHKNLHIIEENAQGNVATASLIAKNLVAKKPKAIVTISTASTQAVVKAAQGAIPIVFASVTDPVAAGIIQDLSQANAMITGAMDFPPLAEEVKLIKTLVPKLKKLGVIYNPAEANSVKTIELLKQNIGTIQIIKIAVNNSNQVSQAITALIGQVEALYIPSDNTVFSALPIVVKLSRKHRLPTFTSDPDAVHQGLLACVGYSQYEVGRTAGQLLIQVLKGEKYLKVAVPQKFEVIINPQTATLLNLPIPEEMV